MSEQEIADVKRCEAGFAWFEKTLRGLDDRPLKDTIYRDNKSQVLSRLMALRNDVLFLYHALGIRDEHP